MAYPIQGVTLKSFLDQEWVCFHPLISIYVLCLSIWVSVRLYPIIVKFNVWKFENPQFFFIKSAKFYVFFLYSMWTKRTCSQLKEEIGAKRSKSLPLYTLRVLVSVRPFVSIKRQNRWTDRTQISCGTLHDPSWGLWMLKLPR